MVALRLTLLGGFDARLASGGVVDVPTKKAQALLAYLALRPGEPHKRDKLAPILWGERTDEHARDGLRHALVILRKALHEVTPPALLVEGRTLALNAAVVDVDVATFQHRVAVGTPRALEQAAELYRGDLLLGFAVSEPLFEEWLVAERERLREMALEALARLLAHQTKSGRTEPAIQTAIRLLGLDPLQETVHRSLMRLYARQGRRGAALKQYQACVAVLGRELGVEPEAETRRLYQELLRRSADTVMTADQRQNDHTHAMSKGAPARLDFPLSETPLFGRDAELTRLRQLLDEAIRGRGCLAAVTGEAGIGKTRLLSALGAEAFQRGCRVLIGRCYASDSILPFGPWVDACRSGGLSVDEEILSALSPPWRGELTRLLPEADTAGLPPPSDSGLRLFESVAHLLEKVAARQTLVLMLEDLHWADEMSLRLLGFVSRRFSKWAALVVTTAREEELADASVARRAMQELSREVPAVPLPLPPLSRPDTTGLVHALARVGSDVRTLASLEEQVWAVSEGNPFVAVEMTRTLQDGMPRPDAGTTPLPQRVRELTASRIERLSERARELVSVAAVIGREFEFTLLQRAAGLDEYSTAKGVEELVRGHVLRGVGERLDFPHDRVRAVVYDALLPFQRKLCHRLVGEALDALYCGNLEPYFLAIGLHFREGEVWDKAFTSLRRAGASAIARSAYREAAACLEQSLDVARRLPRTADTATQIVDTRLELRDSLWASGDVGQGLEHLTEAEAMTHALGDMERLGWVSVRLCHHYWVHFDLSLARRHGRRALDIAESRGDIQLLRSAISGLGNTARVAGDYVEAVEHYRRAIEILKHAHGPASVPNRTPRHRLSAAVSPGHPRVIIRARLGQTLAVLGEFEEALAEGREALRAAEEMDHPYSLVTACMGLGHTWTEQGDLGQAACILERGHEVARKYELSSYIPYLLDPLGLVVARSRRHAEGVSLVRSALDGYAAMRKTRPATTLLNLAEACLLADRLDEAGEAADTGLAAAQRTGERGAEARARYITSECAACKEGLGGRQAFENVTLALALAERLNMRPLVAHCHLGLGKLYRRTGKREQAQEHLTTATTMYREMGMRYWLEKAEAELTD